MARQPLQTLVNQFWFLSRRHRLAGFTLLELLVSILIGGIAISSLLALVVDLLKTDQRESTRNETQSEMQTALDFISQDLREAVYVYAGDCLQGRQDDPNTSVNEYCPGIINHITIPANSVPVLAFWKLEPLPSRCQNTLNQPNDPCQSFRISSRTYSLMVYFLARNQQNDVWQGQARVTRYVLDQFTEQNNNLVQTAGYVNPIDSRTSFRTWPRSRQADGTWLSLQNQLPASRSVTLVDFVDARGGSPEPCDPADPDYITSPSSTTLGTSFAGVRSFYACVRVANTANQQNQQNGLNQDVIVFLRGNAFGKRGNNDSAFLPTLQTQILGRGVVDKQPQPPQ